MHLANPYYHLILDSKEIVMMINGKLIEIIYLFLFNLFLFGNLQQEFYHLIKGLQF